MREEAGSEGLPSLAQALGEYRQGSGVGMTPSVASQETRLAPLWGSRPWGVNVALRWTLENPIKTGRHPLGVIAVVVTIAAVVLIGGLFLRLLPMSRLRPACLQRLALEILFLLLLLF